MTRKPDASAARLGAAALGAVLPLALAAALAGLAPAAAIAQEPAPAAPPVATAPAAPSAPPAATPPAMEPPAAAPAAAGTVPAAQPVAGAAERITFRAAVDRALTANTTVQEAVAEVLRAEALVKETRASSLPQVSVTAAYTRYQYETTFGPVVVQPFGIKSETGSLSVPLVNLANWAAWAHAIDNVTVAKLSIVDAKRRVATAAANAYLMVVARHRTLEANQRALDTAKAHLDISQKRRAAGAASRLEEVQAAQDVSNDEVLVEQSTIDLHRAQEALGVLLSADGPFDAADEPAFEGLGPIDQALSGIEDRRADVKVLAMRQSAAEHVLRDSWRDFVPTLGLSFQELLQQPGSAFVLPHEWQGSLLLTIPIYEGGLRLAERSERAALVQEAAANLAGGKVQARSDVRIAADAIHLADQGLASARNAAAQAHDALDIVNLSYNAGASTSLDVLDAQRRARDADTSVATAEDAARQARLDFLVGAGQFP
jgi:outer membrane protein TolC